MSKAPALCCGTCAHLIEYGGKRPEKPKRNTPYRCGFVIPMGTIPISITQACGGFRDPNDQNARMAIRTTDGGDCPCWAAFTPVKE